MSTQTPLNPVWAILYGGGCSVLEVPLALFERRRVSGENFREVRGVARVFSWRENVTNSIENPLPSKEWRCQERACTEDGYFSSIKKLQENPNNKQPRLPKKKDSTGMSHERGGGGSFWVYPVMEIVRFRTALGNEGRLKNILFVKGYRIKF